MYSLNQLHLSLGAAVLTLVFAPLLFTQVANASTSEAGFEVGLSDPSVLKVHEGTIEVTEDGTIIENLELRGTLRIEAADVVVRNVWVYTTASWTVYVASGSATFENVEIGHPDVIGERGIGGSNIVASGLDIHSVEDGIKLGSNSQYSNVWVHDLDTLGDQPHFDAVQADGGAMGSSITHSVLSSVGPKGIGNAAVFLKSDQGPIADITISNSYLEGGNYMNSVRDGGNGLPTGVTFDSNRIGETFRYGVTRFDADVEWSSNVWDTSGEPVNTGDKVPPPATTTTTTIATTTTAVVVPGSTSTTATATTEAPVDDTTSSSPSTTSAALDQTDPDGASDEGRSMNVVLGVASVGLLALLIAVVASRRASKDNDSDPPAEPGS